MSKRSWYGVVLVLLFLAVTLAFVKSLLVWRGFGVFLWGPVYSGPLVSVLTYKGLRAAREERRGGYQQTSLCTSHDCAILFPLGAPFLWLAGSVAEAVDEGIFLHCLLFLPVMCALTFRISEGYAYAVILAGVPGQYVLAGALVDVFRGEARSRRVIITLLIGASCIAGLLVYYMLWLASRPGKPLLTTIQYIGVVGFHCAVVAALTFEAMRRWRRGGGAASHSGVSSNASACQGG